MTSPPEQSVPEPPLVERLRAPLERSLALVSGLLLMATIGLVLTSLRSPWAFRFWAAMFPLFGLAALWDELRRARGEGAGTAVLRVVAHWSGPLAALWIVFLMLRRGLVDGQVAGFLALLVLALACFFAGIHGAPALGAVAAFLALGVVVAVALQAYLWILAASGALVAVGLLAWRLRQRSAPTSTPTG